MRPVLIWIRTAVAAVAALIKAAIRRLQHGPLVPGWTWGVELWRAGFGAALDVGIRMSDPEQWNQLMVDAPIQPTLRRQIHVTSGSVGGVPGKWFRHVDWSPEKPTILFLHGGGYVVGTASSEQPLIAGITVASGAETFSAEYRLAPKHVFPAAIDDAYAAYHGLLTAGCDPTRIVVAGDSAGGGLSLALLVKLRDEGDPLPAGAALFSPWVDLTNSGASMVTNAATDYLSAIPSHGAPLYLGDADATQPLASPLFADLTGLPPLLVFAGGKEMLLDDSVRLQQRALEAGVEIALHVEPEMFHVWPVMLPRHPASERAFEITGDWIRQLTAMSHEP